MEPSADINHIVRQVKVYGLLLSIVFHYSISKAILIDNFKDEQM